MRITAADRCGNLTSRTVAISGTLVNPFSDLNNHWSRVYVDYCYREGMLNGSEDGSGNLLYRPDDSMTRQEFAAAVVRVPGRGYQPVQRHGAAVCRQCVDLCLGAGRHEGGVFPGADYRDRDRRRAVCQSDCHHHAAGGMGHSGRTRNGLARIHFRLLDGALCVLGERLVGPW